MKYKFVLLLSVVSTFLQGCDNSQSTENKKQAQELVKRSLDNMIQVSGGEFLMGDFGPLVGEKLPFTGNDDDKDLHKVVLSDFALGKYKVTYKEYDEYSAITHSNKITPLEFWIKDYPKLRSPDMPAVTTWQQAKDYCQWLGKQSGKK
ncbi:hypothetical protein BSPA111_05970 [Buttiauxella sp. A111]|nr:hypothetical protein BSPA111_05970 [Buttiauxella sp. A111]